MEGPGAGHDRPSARVGAAQQDGELLDRLSLGDPTAFEDLVEWYRGPVYCLAYRMTQNRADAEEVAQEVFLRAHRSLSNFRRASSLKTWLFRIAINLSVDQRRRARPPEELLSAWGEAGEGLEALEQSGLRASLQESIARLPHKQRATLVLRIFHDLSFKEISEALDSPLGTVKANYHHAVAQLRRLVRARPTPRDGDLAREHRGSGSPPSG